MAVDWATISHFRPDEFSDPDAMDDTFVSQLDALRALAGVPVVVTSSYREGDPRSHGKGLAVDIADNRYGRNVASGWRHQVLSAAYELGFRRVGVYDKHIHLDMDDSLPQDVTWWGESS